MQTVLLHGLAISSLALVNGFGFTREKICCLALKGLFHKDVVFSNSSAYTTETHRYWSAANFVEPSCVFAPDTADKVTAAIKIFKRTQCNFSVRGGGHHPAPSINGKDNSVLLVTTKLNTINIKGGIAKIGSGNTWNEVYAAGGAQNVVVPGGRVGNIGVAGLVLGGGINYQGSEYGFSCDNVVNFQVVTGSGLVHDANATHHSDLFWALKGGGNRFGIVTRIDMKTYPLSNVYGGTITYSFSSLRDILEQLDHFHREERDPKSSLILNLVDAQDIGAGQFITLVLYYGLPVTSTPAVFQPFFDIPGILSSTVTQKPYASLIPTDDQLPPGVFSHSWRTFTYKRSANINKAVSAEFQEKVYEFRKKKGPSPSPGIFVLSFEPFSTGLVAASHGTPGNALGLSSDDGPQMLLLLTYSWTDKTEARLRMSAARDTMNSMRSTAASAGRLVDFVYLNGASPDQRPYESYGKENYENLRNIRKRYDPDDVFLRLQAGGFPL